MSEDYLKFLEEFDLTGYEIDEVKKINGHLNNVSKKCIDPIKYTNRGIRPNDAPQEKNGGQNG